jgi:hypothetical protein
VLQTFIIIPIPFIHAHVRADAREDALTFGGTCTGAIIIKGKKRGEGEEKEKGRKKKKVKGRKGLRQSYPCCVSKASCASPLTRQRKNEP